MNLLLLLAVAVPLSCLAFLSWLALLGVMTLGAVINVIGIAVSPACERVSPCFAIASSALHSMHPIRVCQHVHAHQSKYDEHNHSGHNPHHTHFGFFVVSFVLVRHLFLLIVDCFSSARHCKNLAVSAYVSLTVQTASHETVQLVRSVANSYLEVESFCAR